jgi:hypothetical protein
VYSFHFPEKTILSFSVTLFDSDERRNATVPSTCFPSDRIADKEHAKMMMVLHSALHLVSSLPCLYFSLLVVAWGVSYHVPHQSQVNTQSSGLPPRTPSLLENPLTFFTNTRHPSQCYHLSFSTKKDCIFPRNTVVNIDVAPRLPVRHIIT